MKTGFTIVFISLLFVSRSSAQEKDSLLISVPGRYAQILPGDTVTPKFRRSSLSFLAAEILPWASNRFIRKAEFARISFRSIIDNFNPGNWQWDDNKFINNHMSHPYQGNLFYNAFRSNGYNVWQSGLGALTGAMTWELVMETHKPAPNDMVFTSLGGMSVGEMTYRLSNALVNRPHAGISGHLLETLAFVINPFNGMNRVLDKKWNHYTKSLVPAAEFLAEADLGSRQFINRSGGIHKKWRSEAYASLELEYGSPFQNLATPFHYFSAVVEAGSLTQVNMIRVKAPLYGWHIKNTEAGNHVANITMSYDFYKNVAFSYSAESFHLNMVSDISATRAVRARTSAGAGVIALAAVPNEYLYYGEGRNYDYGCGLGIAAASKLQIGHRFVHLLQYRRGWFKTVNGFHSSYYLGTTNSEIKYKVAKQFSFGFEWGSYFLRGKYEGYPNVRHRFSYVRFCLEHGFRF